jgi:beta-lactam-binding protein with PASTA domain
MPSFVGRPLAEANAALVKAGFAPGKVRGESGTAGVIVKQSPAAGQRVTAGATISFEVKQ